MTTKEQMGGVSDTGTEGGSTCLEVLPPEEASRLRGQLETWRQELIDLSKRNRLLWFSSAKAALRLDRPAADAIFGHVMGGGAWRFYSPPAPRPNPPDPQVPPRPHPPPGADELVTDKTDPEVLQRALRGMARRSAQAFTDAGILILHLGFGMLRWRLPNEDQEASSPLLLVPVLLERPSPREPFELRRAEGELVINPALAVRLLEFGVTLPSADDLDDVQLDTLYSAVRAACRQWPDWRVEDEVVLATFSFQKLAMHRDLGDNTEGVLCHPTVQALAMGRSHAERFSFAPIPADRLDDEVEPERLVSILDADATQRQCIKAAIDGRTFVIDGPPGTGKSQTIANIIAELIGGGKSVLFVSEKAAALDVVQNRLTSAGLGEYLLPLHSHKANRKDVAQELGRALMSQPEPPAGMDRTRLERLRARRRALSEYVAAINEVRQPLGRTLSWAIGKVALLHDLPKVAWWGGRAKELTAEEFTRVLDEAEALARNWDPVLRGEDFLWRDLSFDESDMQLRHAIEGDLDLASAALHHLQTAADQASAETGLAWSTDLAGTRRLQALLDHLTGRPDIPAHWLHDPKAESARTRAAELKAGWDHLRQSAAQLAADLGASWRDLDASAGPALAASESSLAAGPSPWTLPGAATADAIAAISDLAARLTVQLPAMEALAGTLQQAFGRAGGAMTLRRLEALAELGSITAATDRPEKAWLSPLTLPALREAATVLEAVVGDYRAKRAELTEVFLDDVLQLDLETLCVRYEQVYRGPFKIFNSQYRQDRSRLSAATRLGKVDKRVRAGLRDALEWQRLTVRLGEAEGKHAAVIGERYYRRVETDFAVLLGAVEKAQRAVELAQNDLDMAEVPAQIAADATPDVAVATAALRLSTTAATLINDVRSLLPESGETLLDVASPDLIAVGQRAQEALTTVIKVVRHTSTVAGRDVDLGTVRRSLQMRSAVAKLESDLGASFEGDKDLIGAQYRGAETDWKALETSLAWTEATLALVDSIDEPGAQRLLTCRADPTPITDGLAALDHTTSSVLARFQSGRSETIRTMIDGTFKNTDETLRRLRATTADIDTWHRYSHRITALGDAGLTQTAADCVSLVVTREQLPRLIERALLDGWIDQVSKGGPASHSTNGDERDALVTEFRNLDAELIRKSVTTIIENCNGRRPATTVGQAGVIQNQANLKRRHMPIRRLLREAGEVAKQLKPCFMMSPLSVSSFLPPDIGFDVIIFDEASQVRPSDAINCIYRGLQLIVAGDQKQLPPTSFFEVRAADGDEPADDDAPQTFDSILDQCKATQIPSLSLLWHYRSQHEALIGFSNQQFYDGNLITFPGAVAAADDLGVRLIRVDGRYQANNTNPIEAAEVARRVIHFAEMSAMLPRPLSIGVVTFSDAQEECVWNAVEDARLGRPDLAGFFNGDRLSGFFVKNLESVQGDERDVIIFSVGYGPRADGQFRLNLGPLTQAGGERRLNVAVTRARRRVEVVSSVGHDDFVGEIREGGGVWHLREYLAYAKAGGVLRVTAHATGRSFDSPLEQSVAETIESWGYEVVPQVGMSRYRVDLGVRKSGDDSRYILGVECDGAMYHSSRVARDRDRLRHKALTGLGWALHRIWSPAWYRDRPGEERRLREVIEAAASKQASIAIRDEGIEEQSLPRVVEVELQETNVNWPTYAVARPKPPRYRVEMHLPEAAPDLQRMIAEVLDIESPISSSMALRRIREAWGVGRAGARIEENFEQQVASLQRAGRLQRQGSFLWRPQGGLDWPRKPDPLDPGTTRGVEDVPPEEMDLAVAKVAGEARAGSLDEITERAARRLGWARRGPDIQAAFERSIERLVAGGFVEIRGSQIIWLGEPPQGSGSRRITGRLVATPEPPAPATEPFLAPVRVDRPRVGPTTIAVAPAPSRPQERDGLPGDINRCLTRQGYERKLKDLSNEEDALKAAMIAGDRAAELASRGRLENLRTLLEEHRLLPTPTDSSIVSIGCIVSFREGDGEETWQVVPPMEADVEQSMISVTTPLGTSLLGHQTGDVVAVSSPGGAYEIEVTGIELP